MASQLPEAFQDLAAHLDWALPTERERRAKRDASTMAEIRAFYDAMLPRMDAALTLLGQYSPEDPPQDVQRLFLLTAALAEIVPAVEMYDHPTGEGLDVARLVPIDIYPHRD